MSTRLSHTLTLITLLCGMLVAENVAALVDPGVLHAKRLEALKPWEPSSRSPSSEGEARRAADTAAPSRVKNITFSNQKASRAYIRLGTCVIVSHTFSEFFVDGTTIPEVNFDIGPSWAGLLPISGAANESRQVWFPPEWFQATFP
jgi:hypothetical protein